MRNGVQPGSPGQEEAGRQSRPHEVFGERQAQVAEGTEMQEGGVSEGTGVQEGGVSEGTVVQDSGVPVGRGVQEGRVFGGPGHSVDLTMEVQKPAEVQEGLMEKGKQSCAEQEEAAAGLYIMQKLQEMPGPAPVTQEDPALTDSQHYAQLFTADTGTEAQGLENAIEEMLVRLDEFCAMVDMVRNESSLILEDKIPAMKCQVEELNKIYKRVDKLEAFVKMVAHHVSFMEEEVTRAERNHLPLPQAFHRILSGASIPPFLRQGVKKQNTYELPKLYRTEDYFDGTHNYTKNLN
ncbi:PREDICTED: breast carcinoma-amplified sequence 4 [Nanorana parkeri]|uniref:breast carcinoma-amplified sequence 4 n=1 Tax=Nanorana parkeri TaxID=125878 RepID=UPI000854BA31|nr:PREDICTED: breast carcinoma-amplified sequence 4 [Nanorana parkeri]